MAWEIRNFEPVYVDDVEEFDPYEELDAALEKRILGERWDDYTGFDCDNYDPYDPFDDGRESFTDFLDEVGLDYDMNSEGDVIITDKRILEEVSK